MKRKRKSKAVNRRTGRICTQCNVWKPRSMFTRIRKCSDGMGSWCKRCKRRKVAAYRVANTERVRSLERETSRKYRAAHPERRLATCRKYRKANRWKAQDYHLRTKRGLTLEHKKRWWYEVQNRRCRICNGTIPFKKVHSDHNHNTGHRRGLLCFLCNSGLGFFKDNPARLRRAAEYLEATGHKRIMGFWQEEQDESRNGH